MVARHAFIVVLSLVAHFGLPSSLPAADSISLRAGPLTMVFEPDNAFLRYLRVGNHEILRGISAPVRDQFWGTVPPQVSNIRLEQNADNFVFRFDVVCRQRDIDFFWEGTIKGTVRGEIEYTFDGKARSTFLRNRIGFCVLHGPDAAGKSWVLENTRGEKSKGRFPSLISPHQPAKDIRSIVHEITPQLSAAVRFEGEVFEMEDQRNWTDASFKTYCTPLEIPYPVRIAADTRVQQKISISLEGKVPANGASVSAQIGKIAGDDFKKPIQLTFSNREWPLPRIGIQHSSQSDDLTDIELARLRALRLDHLRVDITPAQSDTEKILSTASEHARKLGIKLHIGLHLGANAGEELRAVVAAADKIRPDVAVWLIIGPNRQHYTLAREILAPKKGTALLGVGHDTNFTELNRDRPNDSSIEAFSYGINPTIHAVDDASVVETLPIQVDTVRTAREFVGQRLLLASPITLRPQTVNQPPLPGELPSNVDARQPSLFNASWTIGSIKYLAEGSASHITLFETVGWKGIMETTKGTSHPNVFPSKPGEVFPVYHVLKSVGEFSGELVQGIDSSNPLALEGLVLKRPGHRRILIANLTKQTRTADLRGVSTSAKLTVWDVKSVESLNRFPLSESTLSRTSLQSSLVLPPNAIAVIDDQR